MTNSHGANKHVPPAFPSTHAHSISNNPINLLDPDSYTASRLLHATAEHLHITTRACFIGPIPEGWLKSHRRDWYKSKVGLHYSSRAATFTAAEGTGRHRRLTGLSDGSDHASTRKERATPNKDHSQTGLSFPQPADLREDEGQADTVPVGVTDDQDPSSTETHEEDDTNRSTLDEDHNHSISAKVSLSVSEDTETTGASVATAHEHQPHSTHGHTNIIIEDIAQPTYKEEDDADDTASIETVRPSRQSKPQAPSMSALLRPQRPSSSRTHSHASSVSRQSRRRKGSRQASMTSGSSFVTASEGGSSEDEAFEKTAPEPIRDLDEDWEEDNTITRRPSVSAAVSTGPAFQSSNGLSKTSLSAGKSPALSADEAELSNLRSYSLDPTGGSLSTSHFSQGKMSSTASLIPHDQGQPRALDGALELDQAQQAPAEADPGKGGISIPKRNDTEGIGEISQPKETPIASAKKAASGAVHFNVPEDADIRERHMRARIAQLKQRRTYKRLRRGKVHDGEIIKMANMLVRVEFTNFEMPPEYDENDSVKIETRLIDKWKEFMLVCREADNDEAPFSLQMYKSRVIPAIEKANKRKHSTHEIALNRKNTKVNLFSSLDKTIAIWTPYRHGTMIYTVQAKSGADSMEWYTFLRNVLGWARTSVLQINVPDLNVNIRLDNAFERLESARVMAQAAEGDDEAILQTMHEEQAAAASIIQRCVDMLRKSPEWESILDAWAGHERIGLAWKRYDRLEWVYGAHEQKMYGTIGMEKSHELELRPKRHYPTKVKEKKLESINEPPPVEGFLIRLTSQRGAEQKLGKLFYKRLYFSTHSNYLVFNRPTKADPPAPPKMQLAHDAQDVPSAHQLAEESPLIFAVNPFPVTTANQVEWLSPDVHLRADDRRRHDEAASAESERRRNLILNCDGVVDICNVVKVRKLKPGATHADIAVNSGSNSDVDFDEEVTDTFRHDGETTRVDADRTFELVLRNGLVIRLQAYNRTTMREWMLRLRRLVAYWTLRIRADMTLLKSVRAQNLQQLNIDEDSEAVIGQFARKWEVGHSYASAEVYHACSFSRCRSIAMSGSLFRKPSTHASFKKELVVLAQGHLIMFQDGLRSRSGHLEKHIHHDRVTSLDLRDCYIYSGLATEADLGTAANTQFEGARPGHHALPRMYPGDGWSSTDEATMTSFVIWHGKRKSWFKSEVEKERTHASKSRSSYAPSSADESNGNERRGKGTKGHKRQKLKLVRSLGVPGKSVVFMARSRAERDHWVMNIAMEIERLAAETEDEARLTGDGKVV